MHDTVWLYQACKASPVNSKEREKKKVYSPLKKIAFACVGMILKIAAFSFRLLFGRIFIDLW